MHCSNTHNNFLVYGTNGLKSDYSGHDNHAHDNVYAFVTIGWGTSQHPPTAGHEDYFVNNHVILSADGNYGDGWCNGGMVTGNNTVYSPTAAVSECNEPLAKWQAKGNDPGSVARVWPSTAAIIALAHTVLGF